VESFKSSFDADKVNRFREVVGIERFHVAPKEMKTSDLAVAAAEKLFATGAIDRNAIDALLFITQTPDAVAPATSALLQARLNLPTHILALDINQGCAGFLCGLQTAAHLLASPSIRTVMILGGDTLTRCVNPNDSATAMLFGDAGFAAVFTNDGSETCHLASGVASSNAITIPHGAPFEMSGTEVFNFTITKVPEQILDVMAAANLTPATLDLLLLHQANQFIVRQVARMCRMPENKVPCRIAQRGNTSVASLPLLLCDLKQEGYVGEKRVIMSAFGVGLTWVTAALTLDFDVCQTPILID
jgi:3-oxoacyl-[acyl-carrier-protein] synthase-3